jgi:Family of unknown function (DUF5946)
VAVEPCHGCGWNVEGAYAGCKSRFDEVIARDFSDALYFRVHRLLVDTYCLQHPHEYCASAKSLAAHLVGLCSILEDGASSAIGSAKLQQWLNGSKDLVKPELPDHRGRMTIGDLPIDAEPLQWEQAVGAWADDTWSACKSLHSTARQWLAMASNS